MRQRHPLAGVEIDAANLSRMHRALPVRHYYGIGLSTDAEPAVRSSFQRADFARLATGRRRTIQLHKSLILGSEENALAVRSEFVIADGEIGTTGDDLGRALHLT